MGEVWAAHQQTLGRRVALKFLPEEVTRDPSRISRFEQEARAASALSHPNVAHIYDLGQTADGRRYIAMELVEGETLRARLRSGHLPLPESIRFAVQVAAALTAAHALGVIHRDIKPENTMIRPDGFIKVLDFGLAKLLASSPSDVAVATRTMVHTDAGIVLGQWSTCRPSRSVAVR
jgi:serine/threonine protein kinase